MADKAEPFQTLLDDDDTTKDVERGDDTDIICPTNHNANTPQERPVCNFYDPSGKRYVIVDKWVKISHFFDWEQSLQFSKY